MEFATGALRALLPKLGGLLLEEYNLQKGLKKGIKDLRDELLIIEAALVKVSDVPLDQLDPLVKIWANDVRELSYAIEDSFDSFMVHVDGHEPDKPHTFLGFIKNTCKKATKLKNRREIANDIKDVKIQVKEVKERYDRYKDVIGDTSAATKVDPRLLALYSKLSNLVGIDEAIDELTKRLSKSDDVSQQNIKTISIVGFGGLGKTTLAKVVYDNIKNKFDCGCFVSVGRNSDKKKILRDILHELDKKKYKYITESKMDLKQLIDELQEFLGDKRYIIVIDDIWDMSTWETIKCALVESNSENRIITTTRIRDVAKTIGGIYNMKPLSDDNSKRLFYSRIFGGQGTNPQDQSDELPDQIFKKCGGVPLSIITLASLLVSKPRDDWCTVVKSIGFGHEDNEVVQNTRKIVSFSYYDLPFHLKTCLLHLSVYPEDFWIWKKHLIWKWVAEGFIRSKQGIGAFEVGQSYYNDLVNRNMIQPESNGIEDGCHVHDIVLDLIREFSCEVNFVTLIQETVQYNTCSPRTSSKARRLVTHCGTIEHKDMGHVRSFYALCCVGDFLPRRSSFKALRVLDLVKCVFPVGGCRFEHLGKLVQLRYLGLMGIYMHVPELPTDIGHDLKFLQTLNVYESGIKELPASIGELTKLMCLCASGGTRMMAMIGKLTSLEELELHHVEKSPNFTTDLGKLTQLRVLEIHFDEIDERGQKALVKSVCNLHKIQTLSITPESDSNVHVDDSWEEWAPPSELCRLQLRGMVLPRRPSWIDFSCVPHLSHLTLTVRVLEAGDLQTLGGLQSLHFIFLLCVNTILSYTVGRHEFQNLTYLHTNAEIVCGEGALPMLEKLVCCASMGKDVGLVGNMPLLQKITYALPCFGFSREEVETAEAALRQAAETHPNRPYLKIERDESTRREWDMLVELGRTVLVVLTTGQSNVHAEDLQDYLYSMFSSVLNNPVIHNLLFKLGSQSGLDCSLDDWRRAEECTNDILNEAAQSDSFDENFSEMMQQMMPVVSQVLAGLPSFEYSLQPKHKSNEEEATRRVAASWDMLVELGRTVVVLIMGQSNKLPPFENFPYQGGARWLEDVGSEHLRDYFSSMISSVLNNPVIPDLLFKLGSQSGLKYSLDFWRTVTKVCAEKHIKGILKDVGKAKSVGEYLSKMVHQMMPVVSQVLAGLPSFESSLQPQHKSNEEEAARIVAASWDMLVELGRTVLVVMMGESNVGAGHLREYFSSMFSSVLNNPVIPDLLFKLGSQSGLDCSLDDWRTVTKVCAEKYITGILKDVGKGKSAGDYLSEMVQQMMPVVYQVLVGLPSFQSSLQPQHKSNEEEYARVTAASWDMLVELGRTVLVLTMGQSNVGAEYLQEYFSSMFSSVLNNPVILDLLFKLGSQSGLEYSLDFGLEYSLDFWRGKTEGYAEKYANVILNDAGKHDGFGNNLSEMMQQMMPVVSQVLAELPPFESSLQPQHNDDGKLGGELDNSLQPENGGTDKIVASNEEAAPVRLP